METKEIVHGYTVTGKWKNGQRGMTTSAEKSGKKYFLKKYTKFVLPTHDGMYDEKTIRVKKEEFDSFVKIRKAVIDALAPAAGPGGNIIVPNDNFVDGLHYYEATELIDGVISDEEFDDFIKGLGSDELSMMMKTAAGALSTVHSAGIIHSDLKLKNIMVVRNKSKKFVAKLIDFDSSYPESSKMYIGGDDVYCSPELAEYSDCEDDEERLELVKKITNKTDIFSLGVVYHYYLSGEFPQAQELTDRMKKMKAAKERAGKTAVFYPNFIVSSGCELKLSDKIKSVNLKVLLQDMMNIDPEKRPTAMQVLQALKAPDGAKIDEPWPEHNINFDKGKLCEHKIVGISKTKGGLKNYEFIFESGKKIIYTKDEVIAHGYAKERVKGYAEPWPEDKIEFDISMLESRGFTASIRHTMNGIKGYKLFRSDDSSMFYTAVKLLGVKYAKKIVESVAKVVEIETDGDASKPWPEHSIVFDMDAIKAKGFVGVVRSIRDDKKGYELIKSDGTKRFIPVGTIVVQKMAKKV